MFALSNVTTLTGADRDGLLILSQESGRIVNVERAGQITSALTIISDLGNPLSVADQGHEGLTMDNAGRLYVVSEAGGGDTAHPQLWVYAPSVDAEPAADRGRADERADLARREHEHRDAGSRSPTCPSPTTASARTSSP